jgi:hypothetical protein
MNLAKAAIVVSVAAAFALPLGSVATAGTAKVEDNLPALQLIGPNCDVLGYKFERREFAPPLAIPDDDPGGITTPPIVLPADGDIVNDVVIDLQMNHTWIGDLIATVTYDPDCTGPLPAVSATILCRPDASGAAASTPDPCGDDIGGVGCASNLSCNNAYLFSDDALNSLGIGAFCGTSATVLPGGCYKPGLGGTPLSVFRGLPKGGCWTLHISDNAFLDTGALCSWSVHVRNQRPVPTIDASWGSVKNIYR